MDEPIPARSQSPLALEVSPSLQPSIGDAVGSELPRAVSIDHQLTLAPVSAVGAAITTASTTSDGNLDQVGSKIDVTLPSVEPLSSPLDRDLPSLPPPGPSGSAQHSAKTQVVADSGLATSAATEATGSSSTAPVPSAAAPTDAAVALGDGSGSAKSETTGTNDDSGVANDSAVLGPSGVICSEEILPAAEGGSDQPTSSGPISIGLCNPPASMAISSSDPLFVLNWNDGLVAAPGVIEFDKPGDFVDLRAQVYGSTVSSYSWDLSNAPNAGCSSGTSTYRLKFHWNTVSGSEPATNTIVITATMTDSSQLSMTLTFKVAPGSYSCSAAGTSATWPDVLAPDKPLENQELIETDSATRPYAVSAESGALYVSHSLPSYDPVMPALGLTYSSLAAERRPIFVNRFELDPTASVPNTVSARLRFDGTWGSSKYYDTSPSTTKFNKGDILQISLQADAGTKATGRYAYDFETTANYSGSSTTSTYSGSVTIINEESSVFGEGWTLDILDRLHVVTGGVILNQGAGNSLWFASSGGSYTTPAGDFSTLTYSSNVYTRTLKDGTQQKFDSNGYLTNIIDRNSNTVTFTYSSNKLSTITDPNGLVTTLSYSGSCGTSGNLCTITDPAGRLTSFTYSSGRLATVTDPDGAVFTFTYDSSSGRLATLVDPLSNTTSISYDFAGRVDTVTRPDTTTQQVTPLQVQSLCDTGCTSGSPGTPLLSAEAVAEYTDPRSNDWEYRLDWRGLGSTTQLTDPLGVSEAAGHMSVMHRDSNALATQFTDRLARNTDYAYDSKANPTSVTNPDLSTKLFEYNSNSQVTKSTDELGHVRSYTYDGEGNLTQIKLPDPDRGGGSLTSPIFTFTYTADGFVETEIDPRGNTTTFTRDSRDRITQITYPDDDGTASNNPKVTFTYDSASNVLTRVDERSNTTSFSYDNMNRLRTETTPDRDGSGGLPAPTTTSTYDAAGNLIQVTRADPDGSGSLTAPISTLTYNSMNRVRTSVNALSNTVTFSYDNGGNLTQVTDPLSRVTSVTYNELNQQITATTPLGHTSSFTYDAEDELLTATDALSRTTTYSYTNRGFLETVTDPLGNVWTYTYDSKGNEDGSFDPANPEDQESYTFDNLDRLIAHPNKLGKITSYSYDPASNLISITDPLSHTTSLSYDARNRLVTVTDALSNVTTFSYDLAGNQTSTTDPLSRTTSYSYDPANRLTQIVQPDPDGGGSLSNPIVTLNYDNLDRTTSLTDPVGNISSWTYDAFDEVLTEIDPLSKTVTYTYDAAGELTRIVDRKAQRREFVYDDDGRRTQEKWCTTSSGTCTTSRIFTYTYDAADQLTEVNETDSHYTFSYDNAGRLAALSSLSSNMPSITLTNTYDANGNRINLKDNLSSAGNITFSYDAEDRMTAIDMKVGSASGPQIAFGYDDADRVTSISRRSCKTCFNKVTTSFSYDAADQITAITHVYQPQFGSASDIATYTYGYDSGSQLTSEVNQDGRYTYSYDNTGQLTGVDASGGTCSASGCDESFNYDVNGNLTMSGYTTGTGNRLASDGTYSYTYDDNGNTLTTTRISDGQRNEFTWDYRNRLSQVLLKNSGGTILQQSDYTYDATDRRIITSFDNDGPGANTPIVVKTVYDGLSPAANPYADFDASGVLGTRYLYGPAVDMILARRNASGTVAWYLTDHLGTVRDLTSTTGAVIDHVRYSAYGQVTAESSSSSGDRFKFNAREYDETGLYYYRARYYAAGIGRFIATDPINFSARDSNLYRYTFNAPTISVDPLGTDRIVIRGGGGAAVGLHHGLCVDTWQCDPTTGEYINTGRITFDYGGANDGTTFGRLLRNLLAVFEPPFGISMTGQITETLGLDTTGEPIEVIYSYPEEDIELINKIRQQMSDAPDFNLKYYNCQDWCDEMKTVGIKRPRPVSSGGASGSWDDDDTTFGGGRTDTGGGASGSWDDDDTTFGGGNTSGAGASGSW